MIHYTATLCSRKASFKDVFLSVDSFRVPMINAQGTWYSPAANFFVYDPGITTERAGTYPLYSIGSSPETSMIFVEAVNTTLAPNTASDSTRTPSTTIAREPTKTLSSIITGDA